MSDLVKFAKQHLMKPLKELDAKNGIKRSDQEMITYSSRILGEYI